MIKRDTPMTTAEFKLIAAELATPIDFDALIAAGVLERRGSWYKLLKPDQLPSHAMRKVKSVRTERQQTFLKFHKSAKRV